jgi:hypothetical protein
VNLPTSGKTLRATAEGFIKDKGIPFLILIAASAGLILSLSIACSVKEPPLSETASAFKNNVREGMLRFASNVLSPVMKHDIRAIKRLTERDLKTFYSQYEVPPVGISVLDKNGITLAGHYRSKPFGVQNYSNYSVVIKALQNRRIVQGKLYTQSGAALFVLCCPLTADNVVEGLAVIAFDAAEVTQKTGLSDDEFMKIDFNK